jgi:hypothetical protein
MSASVSTKYKVVVALLLVSVVWLASALVRAENQRYALSVGLCVDKTTLMADSACPTRTKSRTGWYWHIWYIYYALTN